LAALQVPPDSTPISPAEVKAESSQLPTAVHAVAEAQVAAWNPGFGTAGAPAGTRVWMEVHEPPDRVSMNDEDWVLGIR